MKVDRESSPTASLIGRRKKEKWCFPGMLRAAATVVALLAALPAVTPLLGGYKAFSDCRNLTHLGPGEWPDLSPQPYIFTGLLVMPGDTCSVSLVTPKVMLSCSLCRLWKEDVNFSEDIENDNSEVRIGIIQGEVSPEHYQRQLVRQYYHWGKTKEEMLMHPVMLVEVQNCFEDWSDEMLPGILHLTPLSDDSGNPIIGDVVGYEHSVNRPIYHQSVFDAHLYKYHDCNKYGRTEWNFTDQALCTWDVSPVRTVCSIDRGAPLIYKKHILGFVVGIVDDMKKPSSGCGEGRIHYNVFLSMCKYVHWLKEFTGGKAKIMKVVDGRVMEECEDKIEQEDHTAKPHRTTRGPRLTTPRRAKKQRSAAERPKASVGALLFVAGATIARLASQC